jgi:ankyrin repeat protein
VNHDEILARIARLDQVIRRANSRLLTASRDRPDEPQKVDCAGGVPSNGGEFDDASDCDGVQTLRDCISTAETVRDTFESAYDPDGKSLMRFSDDFERQIPDDQKGYDQKGYENSDWDGTQPEYSPRADDDLYDADEFFGLSKADHDDSRPPEVLSMLIDDLREHAQKDLEAGNPKRAEVHLIEAIEHAEEREKKHGVLFKDRVELQERLAIVYQSQKKWAEARKILHGLLQQEGDSRPEFAAEKALQRSGQYLLLATIHHEMYLAHPGNEDPQQAADLQSAERYATLAFSKRFKLRGTVSDQQDSGFLEAVRMLIQIHEAQGRTVLAESYHRQFMTTSTPANPLPNELLRTLSLNTGSDFDVIDIDELLISAIKQGDHSSIQSLLQTANVNCRCSRDKTPLMYAVEQADEVSIRKLLNHGADINATTSSGSTALHQAVVKGNVRMARLLLELDADIEATDNNLATPLVKAVEKNHGLLVSYLLGQGANIHVKDKAGWTLLHHAAHNGAVDVLQHLLYPSHEMNVNATCPARKTALHYCAELTLIEPAKILLDHGANVEASDANSRTPLFFAVNRPCNKKREQFVKLLLESGAQIDPTRLPARQRDYAALQSYPSRSESRPLPSPRRRESTNSVTTSGTTQTGRSFLRRFSLSGKQTREQ